MKLAAALFFVCVLLLAIVVPVTSGVNPQPARAVTHPAIWADGGTPVPPTLPNSLAA